MYYTKEVTSGGKVKYVPVEPKELRMELDDGQYMTLAATIATCILIGMEQHLPSHTLKARKIIELEASIAELAKLNGSVIDDDMMEIGTGAWAAAVDYLAQHVN